MASQYHGTDADLRNLFRPGSGMTFRRLAVLIHGLPWDSVLMTALREAAELAKTPTVDRLRERQREFEERNARALAKEAG